VPVRPLPDNPSLQNLKNQAKTLQRRVRAGDPAAVAQVEEFDPRAAAVPSILGDYALTAAQLVTARRYGFASWQKLRAHLDVVREYARWPERAPDPAATDADPAARADQFLRLACLFYSGEGRHRRQRARDLLAAHPGIATASVHTMAAVGEVAALRRLLAEDPSEARRSGGPFDWEPLCYLAYSRIGDTAPGRSAVEAARQLLDAGADPNVGYLWRGLPSPFTALTGVFGGGERHEPPHPDSLALARLLLEAGADPNDNQTLYNRQFTPVDDHLELLLAYGLGKDADSPWRRRMGHTYPSPAAMVQEQLRRAADQGLIDRVRLLLDHGVDPDGRGYHPAYGDRTAYQLAVAAGNRDIADLLVRAGARTAGIDAVQEFLGACMAGDRALVERVRIADPSIVQHALTVQPDAVVRATRTGRLTAVRLVLDLGFDVHAGGGTALHHAAMDGNLPIVQLLLDRGADPHRRDPDHDSTPQGWAEHAARHHDEGDGEVTPQHRVIAFLAALDAEGGDRRR
jgi:hypothetical protein